MLVEAARQHFRQAYRCNQRTLNCSERHIGTRFLKENSKTRRGVEDKAVHPLRFLAAISAASRSSRSKRLSTRLASSRLSGRNSSTSLLPGLFSSRASLRTASRAIFDE